MVHDIESAKRLIDFLINDVEYRKKLVEIGLEIVKPFEILEMSGRLVDIVGEVYVGKFGKIDDFEGGLEL